jgi:hypothetical protein
MVVVLVVVIPVGVLVTGAVVAGFLGHLNKVEADDHGDDVWRELNY